VTVAAHRSRFRRIASWSEIEIESALEIAAQVAAEAAPAATRPTASLRTARSSVVRAARCKGTSVGEAHAMGRFPAAHTRESVTNDTCPTQM